MERYLFDVNGYITVENALSPAQVAAINSLMDEHVRNEKDPNAGFFNFPSIVEWRGPMLDLIDNPVILPHLEALFGPPLNKGIHCYGPQFRLDHAYGFLIRPGEKKAGAPVLHGGAIPHFPAHFYKVENGQIRTGEVAVVYNLTDHNENDGGFGCVPGTHKSSFNIPEALRDLSRPQPAVKNVTGRAGTAIIFTEDLAHGTLPWNAKHERRTLYYKYTPYCIGLGERYLDEALADCEELTERQRALIEAPNNRGKGRKRSEIAGKMSNALTV
jgi:ectoine hydroxylase-related dioxygenase (phytanoyl-CoA dioxygenase family)